MTDGRQLLDENGNLFGVVNIVDVLVVLMVLAVAAAGGALVLAAGDEPTEEPEPDTATKYATIDLGNQPDHVVEQIEEGDSVDLGGQSSLTITDMHATPVANPDDDTDIHLAIRAEVEGVMEDDSFRIGDEGLQLGQEFELDTEEYTANGEVTAVDDESDALARTTKPVLIETSMSAGTAEEIQPGDEHELAGSTVATVAEVYSYPTASDERLVLLGVELTALEGVDQPTYGGDEVTTDTQIAFSTAAYDVTGPVIRSDSTTEFGEPTTTTAEVELTGVDEEFAETFEAGMTETERGETLATITDVDVQPAQVVLESDDSDIHLRDHPTEKDVRLTVELETRQTDSTLRFHGTSIEQGDTITLAFEDLTIDGELKALDQ